MKKVIIVTSIFILSINTLAQLRFISTFDSIAIDQQIDSHFGMDYEIDDLIFVDSLEINYDRNRNGIDDEYGTLDNCIVFTASRYERYKSVNRIIGVYRYSQVIWYSDNIEDKDIIGVGFIDMIEDINNDGKLEIFTIWLSEGGAAYRSKTLYVHSWDGNQGDAVVYSPSGGSPIGCDEFSEFEYIDINGDGKWEIVSFPSVYEWDGSNYVDSETIQLDSINMFFPRNNFIPVVKAWVDRVNDKYIYNYKLENSSQSAQSINKFDVYGFDVINQDTNNYYYNVTIPNDRWYGDDRMNSVTWAGYPIRPGNSLSGFSYTANGLPHIGYTYLRGYNYQWSGDYEENTSVKDYLNNSVIIKTIAAKLPPDPLIPKELLDSLLNFNQQSSELGWITNQSTANKYDSLFNLAKTQLQQNNNNAAKTTLQTVLQEVDIDSIENITSEAYALIRYNTEYLISKIPEQSSLGINSINPAMSLINPGSFTMEIKGTGFTTSSIFYFNGNARTTTFVSDSILNAQILSTDVSAAGNFPVWVSDGTTNSDTLYYSVVSTLPKPVRPVLECVRNNGDGTYTAFFDYKNDNSVSVYIPVGNKNKFTPTPEDRGQTTVFQPGRKYKVFIVNFNGSNLVWTLNGRTSTASSNSAPCN